MEKSGNFKVDLLYEPWAGKVRSQGLHQLCRFRPFIQSKHATRITWRYADEMNDIICICSRSRAPTVPAQVQKEAPIPSSRSKRHVSKTLRSRKFRMCKVNGTLRSREFRMHEIYSRVKRGMMENATEKARGVLPTRQQDYQGILLVFLGQKKK